MHPARARRLGRGALRTRHPGIAASAGVFSAALLAFLAIGAALPVLPDDVRGPLHSSDLAVGIVVGAFALTAVVCRPLAGRQADMRGRRTVLVAGASAMALGGLLYLLASSVGALIAARLVVGAGEGAVYTAGATWAVDLAPEDRRGLALGLFGLAVWGGLSLGPLAGELLRAGVSYNAVWVTTAVLPLAGALLALRLPEPPGGGAAEPGPLAIFPRAAHRPGIALARANGRGQGWQRSAWFGARCLHGVLRHRRRTGRPAGGSDRRPRRLPGGVRPRRRCGALLSRSGCSRFTPGLLEMAGKRDELQVPPDLLVLGGGGVLGEVWMNAV